jgi:hypothetical protein
MNLFMFVAITLIVNFSIEVSEVTSMNIPKVWLFRVHGLIGSGITEV